MPGRLEPFIKNGVYHIFNKTIGSKKIFVASRNAGHFMELLPYYRSTKAVISYSKLKELKPDFQKKILKKVSLKKFFKVQILAYCLMPTHFHLMLREILEGGISKFIGDVVNAFTRYLNIKNEEKGPIFLTKFKSVTIRSDPQANHVSRYIHTNPYSSGVVKNLDDLISYPWSSFPEYVEDRKRTLCETDFILSNFDKNRDRYKEFVLNHADYQKTLEFVKHTEKWQ